MLFPDITKIQRKCNVVWTSCVCWVIRVRLVFARSPSYWYTSTNVICTMWRPLHFYCVLKSTHEALEVHGKSFYGCDICSIMSNNDLQIVF